MAKWVIEPIQDGGITLPSIVHSNESVRYAHRCFQVRDSDVFNLTYPKSGTTWMQEILTLIYSNGDPTFSRLFTLSMTPRMSVSLYHAKMSSFLEYREDFGESIELFSAGKILFGSRFDHVKSWMAYKNEKKFLLLVYDELLKNLDPAAVESVVENSSFGVIKSNKMVNYSLVPEDVMRQKIRTFLRKGISGDWKTHFTAEQSAAFHHLYQENMNSLKITFPWD